MSDPAAALINAMGKVTNHLLFRSNSHTILPFIRAASDQPARCPLFTLNAIVKRPDLLPPPANRSLWQLSLRNAAIPILDDTVRTSLVALLASHYRGKASPQELEAAITELKGQLSTDSGDRHLGRLLEQSLHAFTQTGYFSQTDWSLDHWGSPADIYDIDPSTFIVPTPGIVFTTIATPPVIALQVLANTFPSVLFTLRYQAAGVESWSEVQFHPFPPFGY